MVNLKSYKKWIVVITILLLLVCFYYSFMKEPEPLDQVKTEEMIPLDIEKAPAVKTDEVDLEEDNSSIVIDIKGAVQHPGVYEVGVNARVFEVIEMAGGLSEKADELAINLASSLQDGMVVYIPFQGETEENQYINPSAVEETEHTTVNINLASSEELQTLSGIGPTKADAIIAYRDDNGPFTSIDGLLEVTGIGEKSLEKIREEISIK